MEAVTELLCEKGLSALTIDDVLERSGVARATLYRHWPTRRALLLDGLAQLMQTPALPPITGTVKERLRAYLEALYSQYSSNTVSISRVMPSLLDAARHDPELAEHMPAFQDARRAPVHTIINDAKASGEIDPKIDPDLALAEIVGPLIFRHLILGEVVDGAFLDAIVTDFLAAHATTSEDGDASPRKRRPPSKKRG